MNEKDLDHKVRMEIIDEERIRRKIPSWLPTLLNGSADFERKVKERLTKYKKGDLIQKE